MQHFKKRTLIACASTVVVFCAFVSRISLASENIENPHASSQTLEKMPSSPLFCKAPVTEMTLNETTETFDFNNAYWMSWTALQAYRSSTVAREKLASVGLSNFKYFNDIKSGLQAFVSSNSQAVVVSFRGTDNLVDAYLDLSFDQIDQKKFGIEGKLHRGFVQQLDSMWDGIKSEILSQSANQKPVYFTGHSLGSALATITAARLLQENINIAGVYLQSAPRVGNDTFKQFFNAQLLSKTYRFTINDDIIPRLPPPSAAADNFGSLLPFEFGKWVTSQLKKQNYQHVGQYMKYTENGVLQGPIQFIESEDNQYWDLVKKRSTGSIWNIIQQNFRTVLDHTPVFNFCYLANAL